MALGLRRSASLLALLGRAEQVVDPGALRLLGRRVLGLTCLSATSVFLLPRLPEAVVMVLAVHAALWATVSSGHYCS